MPVPGTALDTAIIVWLSVALAYGLRTFWLARRRRTRYLRRIVDWRVYHARRRGEAGCVLPLSDPHRQELIHFLQLVDDDPVLRNMTDAQLIETVSSVVQPLLPVARMIIGDADEQPRR